MQVFICDDERKMADSLANMVEEKLESGCVKVFYSGQELWNSLCSETCHVVFLDIDMPDISGLDIASKMSQLSFKPLLVFVTSHDELVYDSLKFHPFGFIRKNYIRQELEQILNDCKRAVNEHKKDFSFMTPEGNIRVPIEDIRYLEADGNYLKINTKKGNFRFRNTMYAVENALAESGFVRIHKGYMVNQAAVRILGKEEIVLNNGERIPIGKSYAETAKKALLRYML